MFRYLAVVNDTPAEVSPSVVEAAKAAGCTEAMLYDAATVCAVFNFFNRWIDATGVAPTPDGMYERFLAERGDLGYAP